MDEGIVVEYLCECFDVCCKFSESCCFFEDVNVCVRFIINCGDIDICNICC